MRKKVLWVSMTLLIVVALILASCTPETTKEEKPTVVTGTVTDPGTTTTPTVTKPTETTYEEKPQYGGISTVALTGDITNFDEATGSHPYGTSLKLTNDVLVEGDWAKGPAGTNEIDFIHGGIYDLYYHTGALAESWEIPEAGTFVFHIRKGVYWHNKAPTNGR